MDRWSDPDSVSGYVFWWVRFDGYTHQIMVCDEQIEQVESDGERQAA